MAFAPLAGTRVVDLTTSFAGPYCTQMLGALGADVVKIEPLNGDSARQWGPPFSDGVAAIFLAANAGRVLTRDEILDHVWGGDYEAESNVVDRQVRRLRAKLQDDWRQPRYIATVPGKGYRFMPSGPDRLPTAAPP